MNLNLKCVKNSMNGQDIYTCVKETKPTNIVEHFINSYSKNKDYIDAEFNKSDNNAKTAISKIPEYIENYLIKNKIADKDKPNQRAALLHTLVHAPASYPTVVPGLLCNKAIPPTAISTDQSISRSGMQIGNDWRSYYMMKENDMFINYDDPRVSTAKILGNLIDINKNVICKKGTPQTIGNSTTGTQTQNDDLIWSTPSIDLGTNQCNFDNKCITQEYGEYARFSNHLKCVAIPTKGNQGFWMYGTTPTKGNTESGLPILDYNPVTYTTVYTTNFITPQAPTWARYCDITCIGPGGRGGSGGDGVKLLNGDKKRGGTGAMGGKGGYIKIHRLRLLGYKEEKNQLTSGFSGIINTSVTKVGPTEGPRNDATDIIYTIATAEKGGDGGNGTNATANKAKTKGNDGKNSLLVGVEGSITYNNNNTNQIIGVDQVSTNRDTEPYGMGGAGKKGAQGNYKGDFGELGTKGCVIITYYYNSVD